MIYVISRAMIDDRRRTTTLFSTHLFCDFMPTYFILRTFLTFAKLLKPLNC